MYSTNPDAGFTYTYVTHSGAQNHEINLVFILML